MSAAASARAGAGDPSRGADCGPPRMHHSKRMMLHPAEPVDCAEMTTLASRRPHRALVATLMTVATLVAFCACFSVWINRQALNSNNWTTTSSRILADGRVQSALSIYLVNELYSSVDVPGTIQSALPSQLQGLAGPLAAGVRQLANQAVPTLLASAPVQEAWRRANQTAY